MTAGVVGTISVVGANAATRDHRLWPLAVIPIGFSIHQALEGLLWLAPAETLDDHWAAVPWLIWALCLVPVLIPVAAWTLAHARWQRIALGGCLALGLGLSVHNATALADFSVTRADHIIYAADPADPHFSWWGMALYYVPVVMSCFLTSRDLIAIIGGLIGLSLTISVLGFPEGATSVWCFFAAGISVLLVWQMRLELQQVEGSTVEERALGTEPRVIAPRSGRAA